MLKRVLAFIKHYQLLPTEGTIVVGVSGGADSLCLLHLLHRLCGPQREFPRVSLHVAHLNHLLRGEESERDAQMVGQLAAAWTLPFTLGKSDVQALANQEKRSLEEAARLARYRFLRMVANGGRIAVAHHADDQVETLLLHWLRGSGLSGLAGMPPLQQDIIRPLLEVTHAETLAYCAEYGLIPVEDHSNIDPRFIRNRIRHEVLPLLQQLNPGIKRTLLRNAEVIRVDLAWLETQVDTCWDTVVTFVGKTEIRLALHSLLQLPLSLQRHLLRRVSAQLCEGQSPLEPRHFALLEHLLSLTDSSRQERELHLPLNVRARFQADELIFARQPIQSAQVTEPDKQRGISLPVPGSVSLPGTPWQLRAEVIPVETQSEIEQALQREDWPALWKLLDPPTPHMVYLDGANIGAHLLTRTRTPGDRIQPLGMASEKKVQDIFVNRHIPRAERDTTPLVLDNTHCLWLGGMCLDHRVRLTAQTRRIIRLSMSSATQSPRPAPLTSSPASQSQQLSDSTKRQ